ncbi:MAG TPA: hypothetical protein VGH89_31980 [Pseudonocardia sp.]
MLLGGVRYSLDAARYRPRCRSCHRRASRRKIGQPLDPVRVQRAVWLYLAGASAAGIAALLGVSPGALRSALRAADVPLRAPGRPSQQPHGRPTDRDLHPTATPARQPLS